MQLCMKCNQFLNSNACGTNLEHHSYIIDFVHSPTVPLWTEFPFKSRLITDLLFWTNNCQWIKVCTSITDTHDVWYVTETYRCNNHHWFLFEPYPTPNKANTIIFYLSKLHISAYAYIYKSTIYNYTNTPHYSLFHKTFRYPLNITELTKQNQTIASLKNNSENQIDDLKMVNAVITVNPPVMKVVMTWLSPPFLHTRHQIDDRVGNASREP